MLIFLWVALGVFGWAWCNHMSTVDGDVTWTPRRKWFTLFFGAACGLFFLLSIAASSLAISPKCRWGLKFFVLIFAVAASASAANFSRPREFDPLLCSVACLMLLANFVMSVFNVAKCDRPVEPQFASVPFLATFRIIIALLGALTVMEEIVDVLTRNYRIAIEMNVVFLLPQLAVAFLPDILAAGLRRREKKS